MKRKFYTAAAVLAMSLMISACGNSQQKTTSESTVAASDASGVTDASGNSTGEDTSGTDSGQEGQAPDGMQAPPDGEGSANGQSGAPDGMQPGGTPPDGQGAPGGTPPDGQGAPGGGSSQPESYSAVKTVTSDTELTGSISSTGTDENAVNVSGGASAVISNADITRSSADSTGGDSSSFYGVGAAVLVTDGSVQVKDSKITTDAKGGAGVFAYGDGTAYVADTTIATSQSTSGGIHVAGGGTLYAWDDTVTTAGESSAAVRSDRGGGTMVVDGGSYTSNGVGSPAVYSTADITIHQADLTANGSEAICIEGDNQIRLFDCNLTGNMSDIDGNGLTWNVILYQSMSGDSEVGNSTFEMEGGSLTAKNGGMFYTTNTESSFVLKDVDITYAPDSEFFLRVTGNSNSRGWGSSGSNGADCNFTAISQEMEGNVIWDSISQLDLYMTEGSTWKGAFVQDEEDAGNGGDGYASLYIDKDSVWTVTADSVLTNLYNEGSIVDASGNTVTIKGTDGTVYVNGTSSVTVTVSSYSTSGDFSGAGQTDNWSDYATEKI